MSIQSADSNHTTTLAIVGGGAAGLFAAGIAVSRGLKVVLYEHMPKIGTKLSITGKGRCNLTNDCTPTEFLNSVVSNPRFLYSSIYAFTPENTKAYFEELGVPLKTERGQRVFPVSDKASDILSALRKSLKGADVLHEKVTAILTEDNHVIGVRTNKNRFFDAVLLATGGASYPGTGSDGSGYFLARALGHTTTPLIPSLVPLSSSDPVCKEMQGLSLKNVAITIRTNGKKLYEDFGEMLFTHFGLSGPMILSASAHLRGVDFRATELSIDLKPSLDEQALDNRLLSDFQKNANKDYATELASLLPQKMIAPFAAKTGIDPHKKVHDITRQERKTILHTLKCFSIPISGFRPLQEAIVTAGGINVNEVYPKTMMSRIVQNLYFAGEILDVDAYTGGFNLQIAFSTAFLAAHSAADALLGQSKNL